jgi:gluconokinase
VKSSALILALDIGTSSLKSALFDAEGRRIEKTIAHESYALRVASGGAAELAVGDLERAAVRAIGATLASRRDDRRVRGRPIAAVGAACFWHSLLGYDAQRQKPTPIYTWGDGRAAADAARLRARHSEAAYHQRTGCLLRAAYWPAKLRWLERTGGACGVTTWMSPAEWLYGRLCGAATVSVSMASGTGLMNLRTCGWDAAALQWGGIAERKVGEIGDEPVHAERTHPLLPALHRFPELQNVPWFPAIGDGAAGNLGSDAIAAPRAAMNVGTSAALRLVVREIPRRFPAGLFCYRVDARRPLLGGAISNAGNLRAWALAQLRLPDRPALVERALAGRTLPEHGLTVLPFWTGERSPTWPEGVGGTVTGLTYATTALDLLQALIEATYHRLAQVADLLEKQNGAPLQIVVSGGIRKSPESLQRLANVLGRPVRACPEAEASLRGAALHVLERLGMRSAPLPLGPATRPVRGAARRYAEARAAQVQLEKDGAGRRPPGGISPRVR